MLYLREVLLWSAIACSVSPVPLGGAHGLFRLCKKPHFMDYEYPRPTTAATPPADHPVTTNKYHTVVPTTAAPYTTAEPASPLPALPPQQEVPYFPQQVFFPPQHGVHDPSEQQVSYAQQHDVAPYLPQLQYVVSGPPQQYASPNPPPPPQQQQQQQQQVLYPPQPEVLDPSSPPQYPVPNLPQQEVAQNPPTQQNEAQYPPPQQQQPVQNLTPTQPEAQYPPPQQQQEAQYPPQQQQQQQQQAQNPPPGYYQGVPSNDMYGPPDYGYYQQPQQQATSPFKKSLGHLANHKFANDQRPFTVYVQQPYPYDFYPTRLYYQLSQALRKPQFSHPAIKSKL